MSLEALLTNLTDALNRNSAALEALNQKAGAAPAATKPAAEKPAATKPAAEKPAATKPTAGKGKAKAPTLDDVTEAFGTYLTGGDADARAAAKGNVRAILNHFGVERASHIEPGDFAEALRYVKQFEAGETPDFMNEGDEGDEGDEDLM